MPELDVCPKVFSMYHKLLKSEETYKSLEMFISVIIHHMSITYDIRQSFFFLFVCLLNISQTS